MVRQIDLLDLHIGMFSRGGDGIMLVRCEASNCISYMCAKNQTAVVTSGLVHHYISTVVAGK
jgi:hypothetical protein